MILHLTIYFLIFTLFANIEQVVANLTSFRVKYLEYNTTSIFILVFQMNHLYFLIYEHYSINNNVKPDV